MDCGKCHRRKACRLAVDVYTEDSRKGAGDPSHFGATAQKTVTAVPSISLKADHLKLRHGRTDTLFGTVRPTRKQERINLQKRTGRGTWRTILHTYTNAKGGYVFHYTMPRGNISIRAEIPATATTGRGTSKPLALRGI